jgi:hypothetical protein
MQNKPVNVFIFMHGMRTEKEPIRPGAIDDTYADMWQKLCKAEPGLAESFHTFKDGKSYIGVEWGHTRTDDVEIREDKQLTQAQINVGERVGYANVKADPNQNNQIISFVESLVKEFPRLPFVRSLILTTREEVMIRGFGDAIYYCSPDGERQVRRTIYEQVLEKLDGLEEETDVRLHIFAHSLGVTVSHDFLFGLFAPDEEHSTKPGEVQMKAAEPATPATPAAKSNQPDFIKEEQGTPEGQARFELWRNKVKNGELRLGTLISSASQLPLFLMRKQELVDRLARGEQLDPSVLGIYKAQPGIRWLLFYDADDLLGFPTRRLYSPAEQIREVQVSTGNFPPASHANYWLNGDVIRETAKLVYANAQ